MTHIASWTDDGVPVNLDEPCCNCGFSHGHHRAMTDQCPVSEQHFEWRETKFSPVPHCPKCGNEDIDSHHSDIPNNVGIETDWMECEACGHQWGHQ